MIIYLFIYLFIQAIMRYHNKHNIFVKIWLFIYLFIQAFQQFRSILTNVSLSSKEIKSEVWNSNKSSYCIHNKFPYGRLIALHGT